MLRAIDGYVPRAATLSPAEWEQVKKTASYDGQLLADPMAQFLLWFAKARGVTRGKSKKEKRLFSYTEPEKQVSLLAIMLELR